MSQKVLGIDIGSYSVKISEIEQTYRGFQLVNFYERLITHNDLLSREESVAATLQKVVEDFALTPDVVFAALPGSLTASRTLEFPFSNLKKIDAALEFEMENYLPFGLDELAIDYHVVESSKQKSSVLVSYARKSELVKLLSIFDHLPFEPSFVGSEPIELGNLLHLGLSQPEGAYAMINLGHEKTEVTVFQGPKLCYTRTLLVGGRKITEQIAKDLGVPFEEAEKIKIELGQLSENLEGLDEMGQKVTLSIRKVMDNLISELKQTFFAFQEEAKGEVVQALYLCGGTSRLPGMDQFFSYRLRKNVSFLDPLDFSFNRLADSAWCRPIVATALSLAIRSAIGGKLPDIQFR
ncbi:MAG: pilus assembly protein PilM, partial [bacterium]|nr:pilus assembly protein PilM [bacterium]